MKFNELYKRVVESQQLDFDFSSPTLSASTVLPNTPPKPDKIFKKWMVSCASKKITTAALYKRYQHIVEMNQSRRKTVAFNCFMYSIKRRLKSLGFKRVHELSNQGLPEYIAASEYDYIPGSIGRKCRSINWR